MCKDGTQREAAEPWNRRHARNDCRTDL